VDLMGKKYGIANNLERLVKALSSLAERKPAAAR